MTIVATNNKEINDLKLKLQVEVDSETINTKLCKIKAKVDLLEKNMRVQNQEIPQGHKRLKLKKMCIILVLFLDPNLNELRGLIPPIQILTPQKEMTLMTS